MLPLSSDVPHKLKQQMINVTKQYLSGSKQTSWS